MTTALIADDEQQLRHYLRQQLSAQWPELSIVAEAENGLQALALYERYSPDVCFLDIRMPGKTGLQVAEYINGVDDHHCQIVFITAYDEFAIQAFERAAIDYLLKPVTQSRLENTVKRLKRQLSESSEQSRLMTELLKQLNTAPVKKKLLKWLRASIGDEVHLVSIDDVVYFQAADKYTSVYTCDREYIVRLSLKALEDQIDSDRFCRIHRSTIVQMSHIASVRKDELGRTNVILQLTGQRLPVSRQYQGMFRPC